MRIIEIGACWVTNASVVLERFQHFVKPVSRLVLIRFCKSLTGISQEDINQALLFPVAAKALEHFAQEFGNSDVCWMSWGAYDLKQIARDCQRHGIRSPLHVPHENAKRLFAKLQRISKEVGIARAGALAKLSMEGTHHRDLDDAVNIGRLMPLILGTARLGQ